MIGLLNRSSPFTLLFLEEEGGLSELPAWENNDAGIARVGGATRVDWRSETRETFSRPSAIDDVETFARFPSFHFKSDTRLFGLSSKIPPGFLCLRAKWLPANLIIEQVVCAVFVIFLARSETESTQSGETGTLRVEDLQPSDARVYTGWIGTGDQTAAWTATLTVASETNPNVAFSRSPSNPMAMPDLPS